MTRRRMLAKVKIAHRITHHPAKFVTVIAFLVSERERERESVCVCECE